MAYTSANPGRAIAAARPSIDRALRKLFPSTSRLTFNPLFRAAVNAFDVVPRLVFPEFRALPPNHLRIRIGVGNRLFNNQSDFLVHARDFWMFVFAEGIATMHSDILDIGVGCGRWAHWLRDYNFRGRRFAGSYVGIDIDEEAIAWCRQNYDAERFRFYRSSDPSVSYNHARNHTAAAPSAYRIPLADAAFDLVFSNSLLSHLLEAELENYLRESYRLLKAGGAMMHSHFNIEYPPATYGTRHTFGHRLGNALIESEAQPEAAVAYHTDFLFDLCRRIGFSSSEIVHMPGGAQHQPILLCRK
jgi:SAM-dependent methyltransferase